jgi:hypothetical protein
MQCQRPGRTARRSTAVRSWLLERVTVALIGAARLLSARQSVAACVAGGGPAKQTSGRRARPTARRPERIQSAVAQQSHRREGLHELDLPDEVLAVLNRSCSLNRERRPAILAAVPHRRRSQNHDRQADELPSPLRTDPLKPPFAAP